MKPFAWSPEKNAQLLAERQLCFEAVVVAIEAGDLLDVLEHPNQQRYPGQRILVVRLHGYVHLVPMIETEEHLLARTIIPPRLNWSLQSSSFSLNSRPVNCAVWPRRLFSVSSRKQRRQRARKTSGSTSVFPAVTSRPSAPVPCRKAFLIKR